MSKAQLPEQIKQLRRPERAEPLLAAIESLEEPSPEALNGYGRQRLISATATIKAARPKAFPTRK
jgi:hypothetical protein